MTLEPFETRVHLSECRCQITRFALVETALVTQLDPHPIQVTQAISHESRLGAGHASVKIDARLRAHPHSRDPRDMPMSAFLLAQRAQFVDSRGHRSAASEGTQSVVSPE